MPGVGITDAQAILELVATQRFQVACSVAMQLLSAACYAPALVGLVLQPGLAGDLQVRWSVILLLIGAMGSAADAVFHLLAHAMTSPALGGTPPVTLMQVMQGPGLRFVLPMIAAFFVASLWLSIALARRRLVPRWNPGLYALAFGVAVVGGLLAPRVGIPTRTVGLSVLALVAAAHCWIGMALCRMRPRSANLTRAIG